MTPRARAYCVMIGMVLAEYLAPPVAVAQDDEVPAALTAPGDGEIVSLTERERAPFAGLLITQPDLVRWRLTIERLQYELDAERSLHQQVLDATRQMYEQRLTLREERLTVIDGLWRARATELREAAQEALERAQREAWEHPVVWLAIGVAVGVLGAVALAAADL